MKRLLAGSTACLGLVLAATSASALDDKPGSLTLGAGLGFLRGTPDGSAFALNGYLDAFVAPRVCLGPLLQFGVTGDMTQIGLSGQAKYWIPVPNTGHCLKLAVQGGVGFVHAAFRDEGTSFLFPLGATADYALTRTLSVTGTFLLNLTDLDTGGGSGAHAMPGFTAGVRF
jgi:hypothetical protein